MKNAAISPLTDQRVQRQLLAPKREPVKSPRHIRKPQRRAPVP
jgi:hypothetical protein